MRSIAAYGTSSISRRSTPGRRIDYQCDHADDVTPEREQGRTLLGFDRQAPTLAEALVSALHDVEAAGLTVGSVRSEDLVTRKEIATRPVLTVEGPRVGCDEDARCGEG